MTLVSPTTNSPPVSSGNQPETYAKNGWKYDRRVTAMMVEDMLFDPILGAKVILGIRIPPHEELRILTMWTHFQTLDDSGFSTGKSFTYALVSALRSILIAGRNSGILSGTFRQGKLIFRYFDLWYQNSKIFRGCVAHQYGKHRLIHGSGAWEAFFRGSSWVRVIPPSFLTDSEKLRSERWHDGYFDEWTTFGNFGAFTKTIIGRVTADNDYRNCPVRQNHIHLSSTPSFTHHPSYRIVKQIQNHIDAGNPDYARITFNYRHIPKTEKWQSLVNRKVVLSMQTLNPPGVVKSEVDGHWSEDSLSFYSSSYLNDPQLRLKEAKILTRRPKSENGDMYFAAFDMARGKDRTQRGGSGGDDFSLSVLRQRPKQTKAEYCLCVRKNNITAEQAAAIVSEYHTKFHFTMIGYDPGGGGMFVRDELRREILPIHGQPVPVYPIVELGDTSGSVGDIVLIPIRRSTMQIEMAFGKMQSDSILVNRIHTNMRNMLDNKQFILPEEWSGWSELGALTNKWEISQMRLKLEQAAGLDEIERAHAEIDMSLRQLIAVDVERDENGMPVTDSYGMYKFLSKYHKDSAYSLVYAGLMKLLFDTLKTRGLFSESQDQSADGYVATAGII